MYIKLPIFLVLLFLSNLLWASGVKGIIKNAQGEPLQFATIFVKESGGGAIANEKGLYEIPLVAGDYTLVFQYLGYKAQIQKVVIGEKYKQLDIVMVEQTLELKTVEIFEGREDPAYTIMRKAIAKASFHRQQLDSYQAKVYIKGSGRLKNAPFFLRKAIAKEGIDSSIAFVSESVSEIQFERPNTFKEKVISIRKQGDDNDTSPNAYVFGSFYQPELGEAISPLSPKAFAYYKFQLDGYFVDRGYGVNIIKVIPRSKGENVFEGKIYIVDDAWSIYSLSLTTYKFGIGFNIEQFYDPIEEKVWLPVTHKFSVDGKFFGFAFEYNYLATVTNYQIQINPELDYDLEVIDEKIEKELAESIKEQKKKEQQFTSIEEKLSSGEELTRKDLRKLMKAYEKEEQKEQKEPEVVKRTTFEVDSMAFERDSVYWTKIRPIPLTQYEVKGYVRADSLAKVEALEQTEQDSLMNRKRKRKNGGKFSPIDILTGYTYKLGKHSHLSHASFLDKIHFNPVEGYNVFTELSYSYRKENRITLNYIPRYAFSRDRFSNKAELIYAFGPNRDRSFLQLEGGRYIAQFNPNPPISSLINTFTSLVFEKNYMHLYEKEYLKAAWNQKISVNSRLKANAEWAKRYTIHNNTTHTWFDREEIIYDENVPENEEVELPLGETEKAFVVVLGFETKPWQKYRVHNDRKIPLSSTSPSFRFFYKKGLEGIAGSTSNFDLLDVTYQHRFKIGARGRVNLKVNAGLFLNNDYVGFADFKHFQGNQIALVTADPIGSFRLLDYYRHSTKDKYAAIHAHYQFRKFLFTQIPEVWLLGIKENLFVNYLATPTSQNYMEAGYSLDNIFGLFRVEAAVAFQDGKYHDFGVLIGISSNIGAVSFE